MTTDIIFGVHAQVLEPLPSGPYSPSPHADERRTFVVKCQSREAAVARLAEILALLENALAAPTDRDDRPLLGLQPAAL